MDRHARQRLSGGVILRAAGLVSAVVLGLGAAAPPSATAWTISAVRAPQAPNGTLVAESCPAPGTCLAVGSSHGPAGTSLTLAELRNGSAWKTLPTPNPSGSHGTAVGGSGPMIGDYGVQVPLAEQRS